MFTQNDTKRRKYIFWMLLFFFLTSLSVSADEKIDEIKKPTANPWDIKSGLGFVFTDGNTDSRTLTFDGDVRKRFERFRYTGNVRAAHGTTSYSGGPRIETSNNWLINSRLDWFTKSRRHDFLFVFLSLDGNKYRGYWSKRTVQSGYGLNLFTAIEEIDFSIAIGLDYSKENLVVKKMRKDEIFSGVIKPELEWKITPDVLFTQRINFFMDLQDEEEYQMESRSIFDFKVTGRVTLRTSYTLNYRNKPLLINELDQTGAPTGERVQAKPSDHLFSMSILLSI